MNIDGAVLAPLIFAGGVLVFSIGVRYDTLSFLDSLRSISSKRSRS